MYRRAADYIRERIGFTPETGIILGTGLGRAAEALADAAAVPYAEVPGFPVSTVDGFIFTRAIPCGSWQCRYRPWPPLAWKT